MVCGDASPLERREAREDRRYQRHHDKDKHHDNRRDGRASKQHRR